MWIILEKLDKKVESAQDLTIGRRLDKRGNQDEPGQVGQSREWPLKTVKDRKRP